MLYYACEVGLVVGLLFEDRVLLCSPAAARAIGLYHNAQPPCLKNTVSCFFDSILQVKKPKILMFNDFQAVCGSSLIVVCCLLAF